MATLEEEKDSSAQPPTAKSYYDKGSVELATETALTLNRLEVRRKLTRSYDRLVITLVGLPARGKSFVARKLQNFLEWNGIQCKIFNVGRYRRAAHAAATANSSGACDANFFDSKNEEAAALREKVAELALIDMLRWLDEEEIDHGGDSEEDDNSDENRENGVSMDTSRRSSTCSSASSRRRRQLAHRKIAIFDATNSTQKRRQWLLEQCTSPERRPGKPTGMVFVESICDDEELLFENFQFKVSNSPDYVGMPQEEAIADLRQRVQKYEEQYETINDDSTSYIKIFNLSSKIMVNHIYGRMAKIIVPALMAWNIGTRPIFLCRPGQTIGDLMMQQDDGSRGNIEDTEGLILSPNKKMNLLRSDTLCPAGRKFSEALYNFVCEEGTAFLKRRASTMDMKHTGTSMTGLAPSPYNFQSMSRTSFVDRTNVGAQGGFPLKILTSTMPRAAQTIMWEHVEEEFFRDEVSNLNPIDKGDFAGKELEEIRTLSPEWYAKLEQNPFETRFPGGESYRDVIRRVETIVVECEQQVIPTLVVSHVSVMQLLIAYFRSSPVEKCMSIEVPLHTVLKFTPARGGGWSESVHELSPVDLPAERREPFSTIRSVSELSTVTFEADSTPAPLSPLPIWGDHMRKASTTSLSSSRHSLPNWSG